MLIKDMVCAACAYSEPVGKSASAWKTLYPNVRAIDMACKLYNTPLPVPPDYNCGNGLWFEWVEKDNKMKKVRWGNWEWDGKEPKK